ncbi:MAG: PAS domain-containing sensor histidine kinase [Planctomycetota bacterium]|nr:MAG: PAS domain-containing sensor histidine kinase [Planctomycetota bacterium]
MEAAPADLAEALVRLVDSAAVFAVALDRAGRVVYANASFLEAVGLGADEVLGEDYFARFAPEQGLRASFERVLEYGAGRHEHEVRTASGAVRQVLWSTVVRRGPGGEVAGTLSIGADLTRQQQALEDASEARRRLEMQQFALDQHAIVAITDRQGRITYANDRFCEISEYSREELLGQDHRIVNSGTHPKGFFRDLWATIGRGEVWRGEICNRAKSGRLYWVYTTIVPFRDALGRIDQYVAIRADITEQKETHRQLVQAAKFAALGELAGNVAHEVNNPIGIISGKARLLLSGKYELPAKVRSELEKIVAQSDRVGRLTRGLLDYCRPSVSPKALCDFHEPLRKALSFVASKAQRYGIEVCEELAANPSAVNASAAELEQVFLNLFLNAIDAMEEGGGRLGVHTEVDGDDIVASVRDSGPGVDPELMDRIFEPFFTTKAGKGTGLGLAICHGLVRGHGGRIDVGNERDGAVFRVRLPLARSNA